MGCQRNGLDTVQTGSPIYIAAALGDDVTTKSPYMPKDNQRNLVETPSPEYPLMVDVWGSTTPYAFTEQFYDAAKTQPWDGSAEDGKVAIHTDATFQSGDPQLLRAAIYNKTTKPTVYFVAFSPMSQQAESWVAAEDGTSASFVFSGNDDVMFAPQVEGTYAQNYSKSPLLHFRHLLTWLRIEFKAESKEVSDSWGAIQSMTIRTKNKVTVDLTEDAYQKDPFAYDFDGQDNIVFSNDADMYFYKVVEEDSYVGSQVSVVKKYTDDIFPQAGINKNVPYLQTEELAYVLCAPVKGQGKIVENGEEVDSPEYYIDLVTQKRTVSIPIDLRVLDNTKNEVAFMGSTRGLQFTITLNFKMGNTIYLTSSVQDWKVGGLAVGNIGDGNIQ
jgi:hypothetical protein